MKIFLNSNIQAFFVLLRAGLWEKEARLSQFNTIEYKKLLSVAENQSVVGLVTAGIEHVADKSVPKEEFLQFIGQTLQIEQQNISMNSFVEYLIRLLRNNGIYAILVKGQGLARCYERPLWRSCGDVDLLLSNDNYEKAKQVLVPQAHKVDCEYRHLKHLAITFEEGFVVELHGVLHSRLSQKMDGVIDDAQRDVFYGGNVRSWSSGGTVIYLPSSNNDVIFIFTHILKHFYIEGIGLRQICDLCRLLWTYRNEIDVKLLERRLAKAGIISEWKAFAALVVDWLGMPVKAMPLYSSDIKWSRKAKRIIAFMLETGNFGKNKPASAGKMNRIWRKTKDFVRHIRLFPLDSIRYFFHFMINGIKLSLEK